MDGEPSSLLDLCNIDYRYDAEAVIFDDGRTKEFLTYKQLSDLSSQLSDVLCDYTRESGVVGVCMDTQLITPAVLIGKNSNTAMNGEPCSLLDLCNINYKYDAEAVIFDDGRTKEFLTYKQLSDLSSQLSDVLCDYTRESGVVGVCMDTQLITPAILIGILKSDAAFYNFDYDAPQLVCYVLKQVGCQVILTDSKTLQLLQSLIRELDGSIKPLKLSNHLEIHLVHLRGVQRKVHPSKLAYCITTSGTTGIPKIVGAPHSCVIPNVVHLREIYGLTSIDLVMLCSPLTFDPSIVEIFTTLSVGARLLIVPSAVKMSPDLLLDIINQRNKLTVMQATPTLLSRFGSTKLQNSLLSDQTSLRVLSLGGEEFPDGATISSYRSEKNQTQFINLYGITEVSVWATFYKLTEGDIRYKNRIPLGACLKDTVVEVRDAKGNSVIDGCGELFVGGYKRQCIVMTSECHGDRRDDTVIKLRPTGDGYDKTVLKLRPTGDIVRLDPDGSLFYLYRKDHQLKRNGKRINLEEIKKVTLKCEEVQDSVTMMSHSRLVTFVTVWEKSISVREDVKRQIMRCLPSHSVPDDIVVIDFLPMTKHGKVDLKHLEDIYKLCGHRGEPVLYSTELLRQKWKEILNVEHGSIENHSNFIKLGGSSLTALNLLNDLEKLLKVHLPNLLDKLISETFEDCDEYLHEITDKDCVKSNQSEDTSSSSVFSVIHKDVSELLDDDSAEIIDRNNSNSDNAIHEYGLTHRTKRTCEDIDIQSSTDIEGGDKKSKKERDCITKIKRKCHLPVKISSFISAVSKGNQCTTCISATPEPYNTRIDNGMLYEPNNTQENNKGKLVKDYNADIENDAFEIDQDLTLPFYKDTVAKNVHVKLNKESVDNNIKVNISTSDGIKGDSSIKNKPDQFVFKNARHRISGDIDSVNEVSELTDISSSEIVFKLEEQWRFDTGKCVDASPLIAVSSHGSDVVFIGSHSHKFFAITMATGDCLWEVTLGDRIEGSACLSLCGNFVIVGCYDGCIYSLDSETGSVWWKFQTGSQVKCCPVVDKFTGLVYVGSHNQSVYCLDILSQVIVWSNPLNSGSVFSSPAINYVDSRLFIATLGGKLYCLDKNEGGEIWTFDCKKPVFSSLTLTGDGVLVGCTDTCLYHIDLNGNLLWKYSTEAPIFSSPSMFSTNINTTSQTACKRIVIGSHDGCVYCLSHTGTLCWKTKVQSQVYSTPFHGLIRVPDKVEKSVTKSFLTTVTKEFSTQRGISNQEETETNSGILNFKMRSKIEPGISSTNFTDKSSSISSKGNAFSRAGISDERTDNEGADARSEVLGVPVIIFCSTVGVLYVVDARTGSILCERAVPGELFSSPVLYRNSIYVGCRDNNVYKFNWIVYQSKNSE